MPEAEGTIQRAISGPFSTAGSFEAEQLGLLWRRCRLLFLTGMAIAAAAAIVELIVPSWGHLVLFATGLALVYLARGRRHRRVRHRRQALARGPRRAGLG